MSERELFKNVKLDELNGFVIADIHFGKKDDAELYRKLSKHFFGELESEGSKTNFVIISGDLFDRVIKLNEVASVYVFRFMDKLFDYSVQYNFVIRVIQGTKTHDHNQLNNFGHYEEIDSFRERFKIIRTVTEEELFKDVYVLYLPEEYVEDPKEYYKDYFNTENGKYDMIFFHGTFDFVGYIPDIESERHIKNAPIFNGEEISNLAHGCVVGGHIHDRTTFKNVEYTGSFERFSFGDKKPKGFVKVKYDTELQKSETEFIENTDASVYVTFNSTDFKGTLEEKLLTIQKLKDEYKYIRIISDDSNEEDVMAIKKIASGIEDVKLDIKRKDVEERVDEKYLFILNRSLDLPHTLQKYIELEEGITIPIEKINKLLVTKD